MWNNGNEVAGVYTCDLFLCTSDGSPESSEAKVTERKNERIAKGERSGWARSAQGARIFS